MHDLFIVATTLVCEKKHDGLLSIDLRRDRLEEAHKQREMTFFNVCMCSIILLLFVHSYMKKEIGSNSVPLQTSRKAKDRNKNYLIQHQ